jgi:hypothetical protein
MEVMQGQHRVVLFVKPEYHKQLLDLALKRGAELGTRVSMGFVIQELLDREAALEKTAQQPGENALETDTKWLFASRD